MARRTHPWLVSGLLALAAAVPYLSASLSRYRLVSLPQAERIFGGPFTGRPSVPVWEPLVTLEDEPGPSKLAPAPAIGRRAQEDPVFSLDAVPEGPVLEDPAHALQAFHEALARSERGQGIVRISHFGDSPVTGDLISGESRARFQRIYGNAGHGWILPGRPWEWYGHLGVTLSDEGWTINTLVTTGRRDRAYGFGGASFTSRGGAVTRLATARTSPFDRLEIHYLAHPGGGSLQVKVDGEIHELSTRREETGPAFESFSLAEDKAHSVVLRAEGDGEVVLYGMVLERDTHGVVYDALGANGAAIHHLGLMSEASWVSALKLRRPDLVILAFGTNESGYANIPGPAYERDYRRVIARIREALPGVSILIMAPMDRAERNEAGEIATMPSIPRIVEAQRRLALETGCAFFNTYLAMGGDRSAYRWYKVSPRLMTGDFTHPTRSGADRVARLLVEALRAPEAGTAASGRAELERPAGEP